MRPQTPAQDEQPSENPFPFGYRLVQRTLPDGSTEVDRVPLTVEDVLHPEPDDVIPVRPIHAIDCRYLVGVFRVRAAAELASQPIVYVSDDHLVDWGVPGQRDTSPDVGVFVGLKKEVGLWDGTFDLRDSGGRCLLVVEVVSPDRRRENDVVHKFREYYQAGVPLYVIVDQEKERGPRKVRGFRHRPAGYEELPVDDRGLLLDPLQLRLGLKDGRVVCSDARTGRELGDYSRVAQELDEVAQELDEADRRIQEQEQTIEQAVHDSREQRKVIEETERRAREQTLAREAAERRERDQTLAREAAEKREREQVQAREEAERQKRLEQEAREEAERQKRLEQEAREEAERQNRLEREARETAEKQASEDRKTRQAAEERIRQLEAALRALQPPS